MRVAKWLGAGMCMALLAVGSAAAEDTPSPFCKVRSTPIPQGPAMFVSQTTVEGTGGRIRDVKLYSPGLQAQTHANVLLPKSYDPSGRTRYPVLYLLHGAIGTYSDWRTQGNVVGIVDEVTKAKHLPPFITVMPDGGAWGFYSDWYGSDLDGTDDPPPAWTKYHIRELIPWIDANYPTTAKRSTRAIAGLSMGGFGTMSYASRFPDLFSAAGSFSGAVNPDYDYPVGNVFLTAASAGFDGGHVDQCVWGDMATQQVRWQGNDPTYLSESLAHTSLFIASGGGDAQNPAGLIVSDPIEEACYLSSRALAAALDAEKIPHTDDFYGAGTHGWSYWQADLRKFLPQMAAAWAHPAAAPPLRPFSYRSILPKFSVWGWSFTAHHEATEFMYLSDVSRAGLKVAGSGTLDVVSARLYEPGARYRVGRRVVRADSAGRLRFPVDLGPAHTSQQTGFDASTIDGWRHANVTVAPA